MIQRIYCYDCGQNHPPLDPEDELDGWKMRKVNIAQVKKPSVHQIIVTSHPSGEKKVTDLQSLICDFCNAQIPDGSPALAVTMWRTAVEPGPWEKEYSQP